MHNIHTCAKTYSGSTACKLIQFKPQKLKNYKFIKNTPNSINMSDSELDELHEIIAECEKAVPEVPMEKFVFGDKAKLLDNLTEAVAVKTNKIDDDAKGKATKRKPAWEDPDDEEILVGDVRKETKFTGSLDYLRKDKSYKEYLTARYSRIVTNSKWEKLGEKRAKTDDSDDSDEDEVLRTVGFLAKSSASTLSPDFIVRKRVKDLNRASYAEGCITNIQFHPTSAAALVAGLKGIATIYAVNGKENEKLHSVLFKKFPIKCAKIAPCGTKAYFGSFKPFLYTYDLLSAQETRRFLPLKHTVLKNTTFQKFQLSQCQKYLAVAARDGVIHLFHAESLELIHSFKQEGAVADMCFTADSARLISNSSNESEVSIFSLSKQRLEHKFIDDGCIKGSVLDLAPNQRLLAIGSMEGVVNVYDFHTAQQTKLPTPLKSLLNLRTAISAVKFNHSSELLAMSSGEVRGAVRLAHFPSATVYTNFPGANEDVGKINVAEFSPHSGYLALGNRGKEAPIYRLKYFKNY